MNMRSKLSDVKPVYDDYWFDMPDGRCEEHKAVTLPAAVYRKLLKDAKEWREHLAKKARK